MDFIHQRDWKKVAAKKVTMMDHLFLSRAWRYHRYKISLGCVMVMFSTFTGLAYRFSATKIEPTGCVEQQQALRVSDRKCYASQGE
jgi:hypothetical protein